MSHPNDKLLERLITVQKQLQSIAKEAARSKKYSALLSNEIDFIHLRTLHLIHQWTHNPQTMMIDKKSYEPTIKSEKHDL